VEHSPCALIVKQARPPPLIKVDLRAHRSLTKKLPISIGSKIAAGVGGEGENRKLRMFVLGGQRQGALVGAKKNHGKLAPGAS